MSADTGMDVSPSWQELKDTLDQICDVFQIGEKARSPSTILANVENVARFADYLHAIEREFLMVPGEADDDFPDEEPENECLVNSWGASSREHYVEQFRRALARRDAEKQAEALEKSARGFRERSARGWDTLGAKNVSDQIELEADEYRRQAEGGSS